MATGRPTPSWRAAAHRQLRPPAVFDGSIDRELFRGYGEQVLTKALNPGEVVITDDLASHKAAWIQEMIQAVGATALYLPPCSPDLNTIEGPWSKVKNSLRSASARAFETICQAVAEALACITTSNCVGFFKNGGYAG